MGLWNMKIVQQTRGARYFFWHKLKLERECYRSVWDPVEVWTRLGLTLSCIMTLKSHCIVLMIKWHSWHEWTPQGDLKKMPGVHRIVYMHAPMAETCHDTEGERYAYHARWLVCTLLERGWYMYMCHYKKKLGAQRISHWSVGMHVLMKCHRTEWGTRRISWGIMVCTFLWEGRKDTTSWRRRWSQTLDDYCTERTERNQTTFLKTFHLILRSTTLRVLAERSSLGLGPCQSVLALLTAIKPGWSLDTLRV